MDKKKKTNIMMTATTTAITSPKQQQEENQNGGSGSGCCFLLLSRTGWLLLFWLIPILWCLSRSIQYMNDYHHFLLHTQELDKHALNSSLWMPSKRRNKNIMKKKNNNNKKEKLSSLSSSASASASNFFKKGIRNNNNKTNPHKNKPIIKSPIIQKKRISSSNVAADTANGAVAAAAAAAAGGATAADTTTTITKTQTRRRATTTTTATTITETVTKTITKDNNNNNNNNFQSTPSTSSSTTTTKDYSNSSKYWNYDDAAPTIQYAITHQLSSIPMKNRLGPSSLELFDFDFDFDFKNNLTQYLQNKENQYPQKLHLIETNPSITILPTKYQRPIIIVVHNQDDDKDGSTMKKKETITKIPYYITSYRITHRNNCFTSDHQTLLFGNKSNWNSIAEKNIKTDYLGVALLDKDLQIITDVMLENSWYPSFRTPHKKSNNIGFSDYRFFTIRNELYFSTSIYIGRLELGFYDKIPKPTTTTTTTTTTRPQIPPNYVRLEHYNNKKNGNNNNVATKTKTTKPIFDVYMFSQPSCAVYKDSKNLQYFIDGNNHIMVEHYPKWDSNDVRKINLTQPCHFPSRSELTKQMEQPIYNITTTSSQQQEQERRINQTFMNFHEQRYKKNEISSSTGGKVTLLLQDRNSACCIQMKNPNTGVDYMVGVVHPKTPFPGKKLPDGLLPNIYLSRFIAFQMVPPYTIIARTGAFCFGYPTTKEEEEIAAGNSNTSSRLWTRPDVPMVMSEQSFDCPRIHFIMSMIENAFNSSQVIISYGVSDCSSRFVTINKVDIQSMLWPTTTNSSA